MGRSSRILAFLCVAGTAVIWAACGLAQGRLGAGRVPGLLAPGGAVNPGVNPGINRGIMPNVRSNVMPGVHPNVMPNIRPGVNPNVRSGIYDRRRFGLDGFRGRRGRFGYGGGDIDAAGLGLGLGDDFPPFSEGGGYGEGSGGGYGYGPGADPRVEPVDVPACPHPLIISIGRGLRHPAHTRVVYGASPACVR